ncbi:MAG: hypothetical protein NTV44_04610 [Firmicutes bacterium]|nr:hypothetical protein [Bacillota bacterium]
MRHPSIFLLSFFLVSCFHGNEVSSTSAPPSHTYTEVAAFSIAWEGIFSLKETDYYIYVYFPGCSHCQSLKNDVIDYALSDPQIPLYFVLGSKDIPKGTNPDKTLGATSLDEVFIVGWPSLIEIKTKVLIKHLIGTAAIRSELF